MQYFFNDHLRWNLGFETPNQGGAWVATLLPWLWGLTWLAFGRMATAQAWKRWGWRLLAVVFVAAECVATWALVKTYSRGALTGVLAALVLAVILSGWALIRARRRKTNEEMPLLARENRPPGPFQGESLGGGAKERTGRSVLRKFVKENAACFAPWLGRAALLVALLGLSGFSQRLTPDYAATDRSVTNRVDLWKGGLELIAISPVRGWGWGNSGASFMHWTQPIGRSEGYKSMVNSYLTVGVEGGLPVLAGVLCVCLFVLFLGLRSVVEGGARCRQRAIGPWFTGSALGSTRSTFLLSATASWAAWLACLFFSNLWITPWLWAVPALTLGFLAWLAVSPRDLHGIRDNRVPVVCLAGGRTSRSVSIGKAALGREKTDREVRPPGAVAKSGAFGFGSLSTGAALIAVAICGGLWLVGARLESASPVVIARSSGGVATLALRNVSADTIRLTVLPDSQVLGEAYGQELRRWVIASPQPLRLFVPALPDTVLPAGESVVAFGAACSDARLKGRTVMLIHPTLDPDDSIQVVKGSILQLSGIDVAQKNAAWTDWAATRGLVFGQSWGLATDVRSRWPELILEAQSNFKNM